MKLSCIFILFSSLVIISNQRCLFRQETETEAIIVDEDPKTYTYDSSIHPCPFYINKPVCCIPFQLDKLRENFKLIEKMFGTDEDGCDVCAANLKRFWCEFTCNPNQRSFSKLEI